MTPREKRIARPHRPMPQAAPPTAPPSWIVETPGTGGGTGTDNVPAPPVTIQATADVIWRSDHKVEIDVNWTPALSANASNFTGAAVYLEDPDISSGANGPLGAAADQGQPLDGTVQVSGKWAPVKINDSLKSPAVVILDDTMGGTPGGSYKDARNIRIYLAAYGPFSSPKLARATATAPTPNIVVAISKGPDQGQSGMEWAFLVTDVAVDIATDYDRPDPNYVLTFRYTPPDPATPVPPGMNHFGGCRIMFVSEDAGGKPDFQHPTNTGIDVPVAQAQTGYKSPLYTPGPAGNQFRVYFCSEDDSLPVGLHINTIVEGVTPFAEVIVPPVPTVPDVSSFAISGQTILWLINKTFVAEAHFSWQVPDVHRYSGIYLYIVKVTGSGSTLTPFPKALTSQESNVAEDFVIDIPNAAAGVDVPATLEHWTIAAISVDQFTGKLSEDPADFGKPGFHSPTVVWDIGPPQAGSPGSGVEYAPMVTLDPGAHATAAETLSADGVGMVSFDVGTWTNPTDNNFGGAQVGMVINNGDYTKPTYWSVPANATSLKSPAMPSFGNFGATIPVDFYIVSDDPHDKKNSINPLTTPKIHLDYKPTEGAIIPARSGWFDDSQFSWGADGFTADSISANIVQVGKTLIVGGSPDTSFAGQANGQIAVKNSSGVLRAWIGEQQPGQGSGSPLWGAWFGQIWIGGTSPLNAPIWIDNQGIIEVGGIASPSSTYPYISVRDASGYEMGRIGAKLTVDSGALGPGGAGSSIGSSPPAQLTAGAWFTQLAVGGSSLSNWNVLITPTTTGNPLGSDFLMRNVYLFQIDYPAKGGSPSMQHYHLEFGTSVWMGAGLSSPLWNFPGFHIYEVDGSGNNFGATFLNRGMVLRGTQTQGYPVLGSLVSYNGDATGADSPEFWAELALYSNKFPYNRTVWLGSGNAGSGNGFLYIGTLNNTRLFSVDQTGAIFCAAKQVIDSAGNWVGNPISGGGQPQTPWAQPINGNGMSLTGAGSISGTTLNATTECAAPLFRAGGAAGQTINIAFKDSAGNYCILYVNGSPVGAAQINIVGGIIVNYG